MYSPDLVASSRVTLTGNLADACCPAIVHYVGRFIYISLPTPWRLLPSLDLFKFAPFL
jgi:hypothetical protein